MNYIKDRCMENKIHILFFISPGLKAVLGQYRPKYKGLLSMGCRERSPHARSVTQDTSRMGTSRMKQEEEADIRVIVKE